MIINKNIFKAIYRDIYQRKARSFTIFVSIAIIIAFPVGFINSGPSLTTSLDHEVKDSNLAQLEIFFQTISEDSLTKIVDQVDPISIESRIRLTGIIENKFVEDQKQEVFLVSLPENRSSTVNIPKVSNGDYDANPGHIGILESYAHFLGVNLDDTLQVKGRNGSLELKVTSFMKSVEFMSYAILGNGVLFLNYHDALTLAGLDSPLKESSNLYNDVILYFGSGDEVTIPFLKKKVKLIEEVFQNDLDPNNDPQFFWFVQKTSVRTSLAEGAELTGTYLGAAASFAVLVTGFIIYVIFNRYINEEKKLIGVLQAFGFTRKEVIFIFIGRAITIYFGSIIFGVIVAYVINYAITSTISRLWGISQFFIIIDPMSVFLFSLLAFILVLVFSILPSLQVTKLTPYEAIRERRSVHGSKQGLIEKFAGHLPQIPKMAVRTLARNKIRTGLTIFAIISAMTLSIALLSSLSSVNHTVDAYFDENLLFDGRIEYYQFQNSSELTTIQHQSGVKLAEPNFIIRTNPADDISEIVSLRGIPTDSKTIKLDILEQLPDFSFTNGTNYTNHAVVSQRVFRKLNLTLGQEMKIRFKPGGLTFPNLTVRVMGIIRDFEYNVGVYVALPYIQQHLTTPNQYISSISVVLEKDQETKFINTQLSRSEVAFVNHIKNIKGVIDRIVNAQIFIVAITVFLGFLIAFISVFNTQYISLIERDRDISIQMAFGFSRGYFLKEFLLEILLIVPFSVIIAIGSSRPLADYFLGLVEAATIRMDYFLGQTEIFFSFVFVLITAFSAAVIPAFYFVNTKRIAKMLRSDE